jgi:hypothetical protein
MHNDEVRGIETEFGITLPRDYVAFMRSYPRVLDETKAIFGPKDHDPISVRYFLKSNDRVVALNREIREALSAGPVTWPQRFFIIGMTDGGDFYSIDCDAGGSAVSCWNHEEDIFEPIAEDVHAFAEFLIKDVREWNARNA